LLSTSGHIVFVHKVAHCGLTVICGWSALCVYCEQKKSYFMISYISVTDFIGFCLYSCN